LGTPLTCANSTLGRPAKREALSSRLFHRSRVAAAQNRRVRPEGGWNMPFPVKSISLCCCFVPAALMSTQARADERWAVGRYGGSAYNFGTHLAIEQNGGYSRGLAASYDTRSLEAPAYWMLRGARWEDDRAWEITLLHHKLYLRNPPDGVTSLSV